MGSLVFFVYGSHFVQIMRLVGWFLVVCLVISLSCVVGREIPRGVNVDKEVISVAVQRCNYSRKLNVCKFVTKFNYNNNNSTLSEEKRVVPTGPNPLHNR